MGLNTQAEKGPKYTGEKLFQYRWVCSTSDMFCNVYAMKMTVDWCTFLIRNWHLKWTMWTLFNDHIHVGYTVTVFHTTFPPSYIGTHFSGIILTRPPPWYRLHRGGNCVSSLISDNCGLPDNTVRITVECKLQHKANDVSHDLDTDKLRIHWGASQHSPAAL